MATEYGYERASRALGGDRFWEQSTNHPARRADALSRVLGAGWEEKANHLCRYDQGTTPGLSAETIPWGVVEEMRTPEGARAVALALEHQGTGQPCGKKQPFVARKWEDADTASACASAIDALLRVYEGAEQSLPTTPEGSRMLGVTREAVANFAYELRYTYHPEMFPAAGSRLETRLTGFLRGIL